MSERLLESRIAALRGQVRRLLVFHGLSWLVAGVVPLVLVAGLADWLFHLDVFVRLALLTAVAAVALWVTFTLVLRPLFVRFADLDIALRIEQRWPGLNDRLASTIQFLGSIRRMTVMDRPSCVRRRSRKRSRKRARWISARPSTTARSSARPALPRRPCSWPCSSVWPTPRRRDLP